MRCDVGCRSSSQTSGYLPLRRGKACARTAAAGASTSTKRTRSQPASFYKATSMNLPDAEALCDDLARKLRAGITDSTGLVGIRSGGPWLAQRLHRPLTLSTPLGALRR